MFHEIMIDLREYRLRRRRLKWSRLYIVLHIHMIGRNSHTMKKSARLQIETKQISLPILWQQVSLLSYSLLYIKNLNPCCEEKKMARSVLKVQNRISWSVAIEWVV